MVANSVGAKGPARRGVCLILSSPSWAGKTTLARALLASDGQLAVSVSVTTRTPRAGEKDGADYFFVSRERFEAMRGGGELLEWARVHGNFYGTPAEPVRQALAEGRDMLFDVDWQGAAQIASHLPGDTVRVFILPPSQEELSRRIHGAAPIRWKRSSAAGRGRGGNRALARIRLRHRQPRHRGKPARAEGHLRPSATRRSASMALPHSPARSPRAEMLNPKAAVEIGPVAKMSCEAACC